MPKHTVACAAVALGLTIHAGAVEPEADTLPSETPVATNLPLDLAGPTAYAWIDPHGERPSPQSLLVPAAQLYATLSTLESPLTSHPLRLDAPAHTSPLVHDPFRDGAPVLGQSMLPELDASLFLKRLGHAPQTPLPTPHELRVDLNEAITEDAREPRTPDLRASGVLAQIRAEDFEADGAALGDAFRLRLSDGFSLVGTGGSQAIDDEYSYFAISAGAAFRLTERAGLQVGYDLYRRTSPSELRAIEIEEEGIFARLQFRF